MTQPTSFEQPAAAPEPFLDEGDVAEMPLLIPAAQAAALEGAAHRRGVTAAQLVRRLVQDFLITTAGRVSRP
jgi:hypothetical protein